MKYSLATILSFISCFAIAQNRNSVWCFGDSALVDFSDTGNIVIGTSSVNSRGSCASICDTIGNLLFYASDDTAALYAATINGAKIYNKNHQIMQNGDSINAQAWYQEIIIIPSPAHDSLYYVFTIGVTSFFGIYYSLVNLAQNGGLGAVTQKNIQLQSFEQVDCLNAVKHSNGRDWWIIFRKSDFSTGGSNNEWYTYLLTPNGLQNFAIQSIGSQNRTNSGYTCFNPLGNRLVFINLTGLVELYNFDRCTGLLSNPITIEPDASVPPFPFTWSCAFSPDGSKLYITTNELTSYLYQYDLSASNIPASKDTLWSTSYPPYTCGGLKLAPDNKIYLSNVYYSQSVLYYPYADSMYNMYNMNLSVINQPDSLGAACDFQPYSFYLGGKRTYLGLPNNPDYEMPRDSGSVCDTIQWAGINEQEASGKGQLFLTYVSAWDKLFINAQYLKGTTYTLTVTDIMGRQIFKEKGGLHPPYFTKDLDCTNFSQGMYIITLITNKEQLSQKFIKE